jgi:hypothetical protein
MFLSYGRSYDFKIRQNLILTIKSDSVMDDSKQVTARKKRDIVVKYTLQHVLQTHLMTELQITQITQVIEHIRKWKLHTDFMT